MRKATYLPVLLFIIINIFIRSSKEPIDIKVQGNTKEDDNKKLLDLTLIDTFVETWTDGFMRAFAEAAKIDRTADEEKITDIVTEEVLTVIIEEYPCVVEQIVPLNDENFTYDEIRRLIKFYESTVGKKSIEKMPILTQKGMEIGRTRGEGLGPVLENRLKDKGII